MGSVAKVRRLAGTMSGKVVFALVEVTALLALSTHLTVGVPAAGAAALEALATSAVIIARAATPLFAGVAIVAGLAWLNPRGIAAALARGVRRCVAWAARQCVVSLATNRNHKS